MKANQHYEKDLADIRQMMERSSKFLSLSGWSGILAGVYALLGVWLAFNYFNYQSLNWEAVLQRTSPVQDQLPALLLLALGILVLTLTTAVYLSARKAKKRGENAWNVSSKRMLFALTIPLFAGGLFMLILLQQGLSALLAPISLLFYGLAIFSASNYTYVEMKFLGLIQIGLGLIGLYFLEYALLIWALGFGFVHLVYGLYLHYRYER